MECALYGSLLDLELFALSSLERTSVIRRWWKPARSIPGCSFCRPSLADYVALMQCNPGYHCLLRLAPCRILFDLICVSFGTRRNYHRLNDPFRLVPVRQVRSQLRYSSCSVSCFSAGASLVFGVAVLSLALMYSGARTGRSSMYSASCGTGFVAFPILISLIAWHQVQRRVYVRLDFRFGALVGCGNWLGAVYTW